MTARLVHDAARSRVASPAVAYAREGTHGVHASVTDTQAAGTEPPGVGGHPNGIDWARLGAVVAACLFVGGFWSAIGLLLSGLMLGVFLFAIPIAMVVGIWLAERWPSVGHKLAAVLDAETSDERRVRAELYRPGSQVTKRCSRCKSPATGGDHGFCEMHLEKWLDERYDRSWDQQPEF